VENSEADGKPTSIDRGQHAEGLVADAFERAGWRVDRRGPRSARLSPDLRVSRRGIVYAVEIKAGPEGRPDRLVPLFAQAVIEAGRVAGRSATPLVNKKSPRIRDDERDAAARRKVADRASGRQPGGFSDEHRSPQVRSRRGLGGPPTPEEPAISGPAVSAPGADGRASVSGPWGQPAGAVSPSSPESPAGSSAAAHKRATRRTSAERHSPSSSPSHRRRAATAC